MFQKIIFNSAFFLALVLGSAPMLAFSGEAIDASRDDLSRLEEEADSAKGNAAAVLQKAVESERYAGNDEAFFSDLDALFERARAEIGSSTEEQASEIYEKIKTTAEQTGNRLVLERFRILDNQDLSSAEKLATLVSETNKQMVKERLQQAVSENGSVQNMFASLLQDQVTKAKLPRTPKTWKDKGIGIGVATLAVGMGIVVIAANPGSAYAVVGWVAAGIAGAIGGYLITDAILVLCTEGVNGGIIAAEGISSTETTPVRKRVR